MADLNVDRKWAYYKCGKCGGQVGIQKTQRPRDICPSCGYSYRVHGTRKVNNIPMTIKLDLNDLNHT